MVIHNMVRVPPPVAARKSSSRCHPSGRVAVGRSRAGFRSLQIVAETDIVFRVGKRFPEPTPRVAKAHIEVEMQSEEPAVRFRELQERVEDRCPVSTLFSDARIYPEVVWDPNTLIRAT